MFTKKHFKQSLFGDEGGSGTSAGTDGGTGELNLDGGNGGEPNGANSDIQSPQIDFPDGLSDEIRNDPSLKVFIGDDNKINYGNVLKSYVHAQKQMGKEKVVIPSENSSPEEWESFYNKVGRPDMENYKLENSLPDGEPLDEEMFNGFKEQAYKAGLMPKQAQQLVNWFNERTNEANKALSEIVQKEYEESVDSLKKEWGEGYDRQKQLAEQALKNFVDDPKLMEEFKNEGLDNSVTMLKVFNKIGQALMTEDNFQQESRGAFGMTPEEAQSKINEMMSDSNGPYLNPDHMDHANAVAKVQKYMELIHR